MGKVDRYREALEDRFPPVLRRWLAALPADGWEGQTWQLWDALDAVAKRFEVVPAVKALLTEIGRLDAILASAGWVMTQRRTRAARLVTFTRSK